MIVGEPKLRRQRMVLFRTDSRRGKLVSAASPLALQDGIRVDMPLSETQSLLKRSDGEFYVLEHQPADDLEALNELANSLETFSPLVGLETVDLATPPRVHMKKIRDDCSRRPDSILLDVTGLDQLFGSEDQLAAQLTQHCQQLGYVTRIAIANTIGVAWGAAKFSRSPPAGQTHSSAIIIAPGDNVTFSQLPIEALRIGPHTSTTLHQLGIRTVEQLLRLPRADLARRFGQEIHHRIDQALGQTQEPVIARRKPTEFLAEQMLEYPTSHRKTIEVIIDRLVGDLCTRLRSKQRGALQWTVRMKTQSGPPLQFVVNLFAATATTAQIMPLIDMQLEQALQPHTRTPKRQLTPAPQPGAMTGTRTNTQFHCYTTIAVQEITVSVSSSALLVEHQRQLFDENPRLDSQELAHLINRLTSRLGQQNVVYPKLQSGSQPEFAYRMLPLVDVRRGRGRHPTRGQESSHVAGRPLRIFSPAIPLSMRNEKSNGRSEAGIGRGTLARIGPFPIPASDPPLIPHLKSSDLRPPTSHSPEPPLHCQFSTPHSQFSILRSWGPERIETGWWRGLTVCRDYWRVETETGQQLWVYRDRRTSQWFLHGEF
jgi:protein ImuB